MWLHGYMCKLQLQSDSKNLTSFEMQMWEWIFDEEKYNLISLIVNITSFILQISKKRLHEMEIWECSEVIRNIQCIIEMTQHC